jgi:CYTH domain-containing protein
VVAEVEFPSREESEAFAGPDWVGTEVIGDPAYRNESLAAHGPRAAVPGTGSRRRSAVAPRIG